MNVVFFGTPSFAANVLTFLLKNHVNVVAVISKPDKPQGRSKSLVPTPVKLVAQHYHLPLFQPELVSAPDFTPVLTRYEADLFVVVAYGEIIKQHLLDMPKLACINVHPSLLPKYRGAAPIQRSIMEGNTETGVTIMHMVRKMDAGDIIKQCTIPLGPDETYGELEKRLCDVGSSLLLEVIDDFKRGIENSISQNESLVTYASKIELEDCEIDWAKSAEEIHNLIRGVNPSPGAWCWVSAKGEKKRLKIMRSQVVNADRMPIGEIHPSRKEFIVSCGNGALKLLEVQLEGKKVMRAEELLRGMSLSLTPRSL